MKHWFLWQRLQQWSGCSILKSLYAKMLHVPQRAVKCILHAAVLCLKEGGRDCLFELWSGKDCLLICYLVKGVTTLPRQVRMSTAVSHRDVFGYVLVGIQGAEKNKIKIWCKKKNKSQPCSCILNYQKVNCWVWQTHWTNRSSLISDACKCALLSLFKLTACLYAHYCCLTVTLVSLVYSVAVTK